MSPPFLLSKRFIFFNLQGKLLHKISRKGRGAEEYLQLSDMFIDSRNRTLNLLSRIDEKLLVFDVDEYRLEDYPSSESIC